MGGQAVLPRNNCGKLSARQRSEIFCQCHTGAANPGCSISPHIYGTSLGCRGRLPTNLAR